MTQVNRFSGRALLILTLIAFVTVLTGFFPAPSTRRRYRSAYLSALDCGFDANVVPLRCHRKLEEAIPKVSPAGPARSRSDSGIRRSVLP